MSDAQTWCRVVVQTPDGATLGRWTLHGDGLPDLATVDWVARLLLAVRSAGGRAVFEDVTPALADLLELAGLGWALGG